MIAMRLYQTLIFPLSLWMAGPMLSNGASFSSEGARGKKEKDKENAGDWCETLQDMGELYDVKTKKNPYIQKIDIFGRYHHHWIYSDGRDRGRDFDGYGQQLARFRFGMSIDFFDRWEFHSRINLEDSDMNDNRVRHEDVDSLSINYEFKDIGFLDEPMLGYGLTKIDFGGEWYYSSREIKTVERSNLSEYFSPSRATGFFGGFETDEFDFVGGIFSTVERNYSLADWNGGIGYFMSVRATIADGKGRADLIYVDAKDEEDSVFGFDWATSVSWDRDFDELNCLFNVTYGRDNDNDIYGFVFLPSTYLIEDRLELVFRYQWAHSTEPDIRPGSRNNASARAIAVADGVNIGEGDENHSYYLGVNYYFCEDNLKLMSGVEYETLTGGNTDFKATTLWGALRFYF